MPQKGLDWRNRRPSSEGLSTTCRISSHGRSKSTAQRFKGPVQTLTQPSSARFPRALDAFARGMWINLCDDRSRQQKAPLLYF